MRVAGLVREYKFTVVIELRAVRDGSGTAWIGLSVWGLGCHVRGLSWWVGGWRQVAIGIEQAGACLPQVRGGMGTDTIVKAQPTDARERPESFRQTVAKSRLPGKLPTIVRD